jgi:hypothetical protein
VVRQQAICLLSHLAKEGKRYSFELVGLLPRLVAEIEGKGDAWQQAAFIIGNVLLDH